MLSYLKYSFRLFIIRVAHLEISLIIKTVFIDFSSIFYEQNCCLFWSFKLTKRTFPGLVCFNLAIWISLCLSNFRFWLKFARCRWIKNKVRFIINDLVKLSIGFAIVQHLHIIVTRVHCRLSATLGSCLDFW